jgi:hypothetical protein
MLERLFCDDHIPKLRVVWKCTQTNTYSSIELVVLNKEHIEPLLHLFPNCLLPVEL